MKRILNFGSLNIDYVYRLDHVVRPSETIHSEELSVFCGGKGLNQSIALKRAGAAVFHAGCTGAADGRILLDELSKTGVNTDNVRIVNERSGNAIIQVDKNGENAIIVFGGANQCVTEEHVEQALGEFNCDDILLLQNEINLVGFLIQAASEKGMAIALNPSPFDRLVHNYPLHLVDIFILNEIEGRDLAGSCEASEDGIVSALRSMFPKAKIVLTLGERGVVYFDGFNVCRHQAYKAHAVDTTAAGDTFTGYFLAGLSNGETFPKAIEVASKAASITVTRAGASASIPFIYEIK